jgi:hypothetical protein
MITSEVNKRISVANKNIKWLVLLWVHTIPQFNYGFEILSLENLQQKQTSGPHPLAMEIHVQIPIGNGRKDATVIAPNPSTTQNIQWAIYMMIIKDSLFPWSRRTRWVFIPVRCNDQRQIGLWIESNT